MNQQPWQFRHVPVCCWGTGTAFIALLLPHPVAHLWRIPLPGWTMMSTPTACQLPRSCLSPLLPAQQAPACLTACLACQGEGSWRQSPRTLARACRSLRLRLCPSCGWDGRRRRRRWRRCWSVWREPGPAAPVAALAAPVVPLAPAAAAAALSAGHLIRCRRALLMWQRVCAQTLPLIVPKPVQAREARCLRS